MRFDFPSGPPSDAPTRKTIRRFAVKAAPFTLDELQFEGVLMEGQLDEAETLTLVPRGSPIKVRELAPKPGKRWVVSAPPRDQVPDPIGNAVKDVVRGLAAMPALLSTLVQQLGHGAKKEAFKSTPELVALWVLSIGEATDGGAH